VAEDHWFAQPHRAETAMPVVVQIRAADAARADRDLDLTVAKRLLASIVDPQIACGVNGDRLHR
jgi:hypothetical protein